MDQKITNDTQKVKCVCLACLHYFSVDEYVAGKVACPECGLTDGVRLEKDIVGSNVEFVKEEPKQWLHCPYCGVRWLAEYGSDCKICNQPGKPVE